MQRMNVRRSHMKVIYPHKICFKIQLVGYEAEPALAHFQLRKRTKDVTRAAADGVDVIEVGLLEREFSGSPPIIAPVYT